MATKPICKIDGCDKTAYRGSLCNMHYDRKKRGADMHAPARASRGEAITWLKDHVTHSGDECLYWPFYKDDKGYGSVKWNNRYIGAHRAMCILAHGEPPRGRGRMTAAHECGQGHKACVNPRHLSWKTYAENTADRKKHGTYPAGENNSAAVLNDAKVLVIRKSRGVCTAKELSDAFGVTATQISRIWNGHFWSGS